MVEPLPRPGHPLGLPRAVAFEGSPTDQLDEPGLLGVAGRDRKVGEAGSDQVEVEGTGGGDLGCPFDHPGPPGEPPPLLALRPQAGHGRGREPALQLIERAPGPYRGQGGGQREPSGGGVVHVVGGHRAHPPFYGQQGQGIVARRVEGIAVVPQLNGHVVRSEAVDQVIELSRCRRRAACGQGAGYRALPAAGQDLPVAPVAGGQVVEGEDRLSLLPAGQMGLGDGPAESGVARGVTGQHDEMGAPRVGDAGAGGGGREGQLDTEHGGYIEDPRRLGEADGAVETVMVGEGQGRQAESGGLGHQLLGVAGAVEEREIGVHV